MWNCTDRLCRPGGAFSPAKCAVFAEETSPVSFVQMTLILREAAGFVDDKKPLPGKTGVTAFFNRRCGEVL